MQELEASGGRGDPLTRGFPSWRIFFESGSPEARPGSSHGRILSCGRQVSERRLYLPHLLENRGVGALEDLESTQNVFIETVDVGGWQWGRFGGRRERRNRRIGC